MGGGYVINSASGRSTCSWNYPQTKNKATVGPLYYTGPSGEKGTLIGTCMNGNWSYSANCSDPGPAAPACPTGNETNGRCTFSYPYASDGQYKSVYDQQGYGTQLSATCKSGAWTNITLYDPQRKCNPPAATPVPAGPSCAAIPGYRVSNKCIFNVPTTASGVTQHVSDSAGTGSVLHGKCVNGNWDNSTIGVSPDNCN